MRTYVLILAASGLLVLGGCKPAAPQYVTTTPIRDLMQSIVDPNADELWNSVSIVITAKGTEKKFPRTDEEWKAVRGHAVTLVEATNLIMMPNRHVGYPGQKADNPDYERSPDEIEAMITKDRATFLTKLQGLREAATKMLAAVDAKNVAAVDEAGDGLDKACEACHMTYWYRPDK
jgi:hypothetical protein